MDKDGTCHICLLIYKLKRPSMTYVFIVNTFKVLCHRIFELCAHKKKLPCYLMKLEILILV